MIGLRLFRSFRRAWWGLKIGWQQEYNLRVFTLFAVLVIAGIFFFRVSLCQTMFLILSISVMFSLELLNSQIERFLDLVVPRRSRLVKEIKDLSAGAVLISAVGVFIIGLIIFIPYFIRLFH